MKYFLDKNIIKLLLKKIKKNHRTTKTGEALISKRNNLLFPTYTLYRRVSKTNIERKLLRIQNPSSITS